MTFTSTLHARVQALGTNSGSANKLRFAAHEWYEALDRAFNDASHVGVVRVADYGTAADGVTDDYAAIMLAVAAVKALPYGGILYFPPGRYYTSARIVIDASDIWVRGAGWGASRITGAAGLQSVVFLGNVNYATDTTQYSRVRISDIAIWGQSNGTFPGGSPTQEALLFVANCYQYEVDNVYLNGSEGWGFWETTNTSASGASLSNTSKVHDSVASNCDQGGWRFSGSKNSQYFALNANNCPSVQESNSDAHGFLWEAKGFSDGVPNGTGTGAIETTQCEVWGCKSSDNGGHGFVFDGTAKYTVDNLNSNANTKCGYFFANENGLSEAVSPGGADGVISGTFSVLSSRRDGDNEDVIGLDCGDNVYISTGFVLQGLSVIGGSWTNTAATPYPPTAALCIGVRIRGALGGTWDNISIQSCLGTGLVVEQADIVSPHVDAPTTREAQEMRVTNLHISNVGSSDVDGYADCHGIHVKDATQRCKFLSVHVQATQAGTGSNACIYVDDGAGLNCMWREAEIEGQTPGDSAITVENSAHIAQMSFKDIGFDSFDLDAVFQMTDAATLDVPLGVSAIQLNGGGTPIDNIPARPYGETLTIRAGAGSPEVQDLSTNSGNVGLSGSADFVMGATSVLTLVASDNGRWYEASRSVN